MGMDSVDGRATIKARIPESELYKYANALRSMTQGRGHHSRRFSGYEYMPDAETQKVVAARAAAGNGEG